jgi:hypothetical protein
MQGSSKVAKHTVKAKKGVKTPSSNKFRFACSLRRKGNDCDKSSVTTTRVVMDPRVQERLLAAFLNLARVHSIDSESMRLLRAAMRMFAQLSRDRLEDVFSVLAHASAYLADLGFNAGPFDGDLGRLAVVLLFLAHSYVEDITLPLSNWHAALLQGRATLDAVNDELLRLMKLRGFILRLPDDDLHMRYEALCQASVGNPPSASFLHMIG